MNKEIFTQYGPVYGGPTETVLKLPKVGPTGYPYLNDGMNDPRATFYPEMFVSRTVANGEITSVTITATGSGVVTYTPSELKRLTEEHFQKKEDVDIPENLPVLEIKLSLFERIFQWFYKRN
jgi:hypothetical protein